MKHLSLFLILLSFYCCTTNTTNNNSENAADSLANTNDSLANVHPSLLDDDPWNDTTEYTPETFKNCCDTLVGNFSGKGVDTLIAEPIGQNTMLKNSIAELIVSLVLLQKMKTHLLLSLNMKTKIS